MSQWHSWSTWIPALSSYNRTNPSLHSSLHHHSSRPTHSQYHNNPHSRSPSSNCQSSTHSQQHSGTQWHCHSRPFWTRNQCNHRYQDRQPWQLLLQIPRPRESTPTIRDCQETEVPRHLWNPPRIIPSLHSFSWWYACPRSYEDPPTPRSHHSQQDTKVILCNSEISQTTHIHRLIQSCSPLPQSIQEEAPPCTLQQHPQPAIRTQLSNPAGHNFD
jgi:hypothetical protein